MSICFKKHVHKTWSNAKIFFAATSLYPHSFMFMPVFSKSLGNSYYPFNFTYEELFLPNFCVAFLLA